MIKFQNGNINVTILSDGTKIREYEGVKKPEFPETIDVKITNYCDLGCAYCHENSTVKGKDGDLACLLEQVKQLSKGVELAIGGGNPLAHPMLQWFLEKVKELGLIANLTVNQGHVEKYNDLLKTLIKQELVKGVGVSITQTSFENLVSLKQSSEHIVFHVIAGIHPHTILGDLYKFHQSLFVCCPCKVLVLGYKQFGRGVRHYSPLVDKNIQGWYRNLPDYLRSDMIISFDNLAIEQLSVKRLFTDDGWDQFYMGDDFTLSMYIDAVEQTFAPTSRSSERISWGQMGLIEYFKKYRNA